MSQKATRKAAISEDKEKRQTDSPVKEMKKKMAANAEKEKQAAEKAEKPTEKVAEKQTEKNTDKQTEKPDKSVTDKKPEKNVDKQTEKTDKNATVDKKSEKADKLAEKPDKNVVADKKTEKNVEKKEPQADKSKEDGNKEEKSGKSEKSDQKKAENKAKQNGREARVHNGVSDVTLSANGAADDVLNGTVSAESEDDDVMLVIDDQDQDELFPELTYDDASDVECFEPPTPENAPSRSFTRRSQVKSTRTPETPRPASDKHAEKETDDPKDSKILKLKEDAAPPTDRKLRSADSPKREAKKDAKKAEKESPKKSQEEKEDGKTHDKPEVDKSDKGDKVQMEVVIEIENEAEEARAKADTNYSKSRVKVSPYRRSARADHTNTSLLANYTGNNTTMEMDITETSSFISEEAAADDSPYLRGLRSIRGRCSYKPLKEMSLRAATGRAARAAALNEASGRPTGTVVGRKRKPDAEPDYSPLDAPLPPSPAAAAPPGGHAQAADVLAHGKRMRLLDRLAVPFRRTASARNAEIVGINTDLPLSAPLVSADSFDPESLKSAAPAPEAPIAVPLPTPEERDSKRCAIM